MGYGSPGKVRDVAAYLSEVRGGASVPRERVREIGARYRAVGGSTPLLRITRAEARALEAKLGKGFRVFVGMKHWRPFIRDTVKKMCAEGIKRAVAVALAPHYSAISIGGYKKYVEEAVKAEGGPEVTFVKNWHLEPGLIQSATLQLQEAIKMFPHRSGNKKSTPFVIFTAHSLPKRALPLGDPYERQLRETSARVARAAAVTRWSFSFQSRSGPKDEWLGPDILDEISKRAKEGEREIILCPIGFVSDHLEILFDIDIECVRYAKKLGVVLTRTASRNTHPLFIDALARIVRRSVLNTHRN